MQRRIAGNVSPEEAWPGERRVQDELPTDRLAEYEPAIGIGSVASLDDRKQFFAQETLKIFSATPVVSLIRWRGVIRAAIVSFLNIVGPIGNADNNCIRDFLRKIQISIVGGKKREQSASVQDIDRRVLLTGAGS